MSFLVFFTSEAQKTKEFPVKYDDFFTEKALRIDFYLFGSDKTQNALIKNIKQEPFFAGSRKNLLHPNMGYFAYQIKDKITEKILYFKGFSPLFGEWQQTPESKEKSKLFENVAHFPFPKNDVIFEVLKRDFNDQWQKFFSEEIAVQSHHIIKETPQNFPFEIIQKKRPSEKAVDLVIVSEGYTQEEMPKFIQDVKKMVSYLFEFEPFKAHREKFNIYAIKAPSKESGTDFPHQNIYRNTLLNTHFYTFNTPRYLTIPSHFKLNDISSQLPCDQVYVLVNTKEYGGGGFYNSVNLASSDGSQNREVFMHEFGHGFAGLADEYYNDSAGMEIDFNFKIEPWERNVTTLVNFKNKWKHLVEKSTPIPTPRTPQYQGKVGAFEGGNYFPKGIYSPALDCRMKTNTAEAFCPVCQNLITQMILLITE